MNTPFSHLQSLAFYVGRITKKKKKTVSQTIKTRGINMSTIVKLLK